MLEGWGGYARTNWTRKQGANDKGRPRQHHEKRRDMNGIYHHPSPVGRVRSREKKQRPKTEKAKKRHRPDFTRWEADRTEKNALFFFFFFRLYADVRKMRVGIQSKGDALTERYSPLRHAAYAAAVALRVVGVPVRSECPSPSLLSWAYE